MYRPFVVLFKIEAETNFMAVVAGSPDLAAVEASRQLLAINQPKAQIVDVIDEQDLASIQELMAKAQKTLADFEAAQATHG